MYIIPEILFLVLQKTQWVSMAQTVSRRPITAEACAQSQASPLKIYGEQSGTETDFSASSLVLSCEHHSVNTHTHSFITNVIQS
jgi:hypothetical protein